jgi:hypothetical protein
VVPVLGRRRQEDLKFKTRSYNSKFEASLGYTTRPCLKKKEKRHATLIMQRPLNKKLQAYLQIFYF